MSIVGFEHPLMPEWIAVEDDEPRGSDICPECGSGHVSYLGVWSGGAGYDQPIHGRHWWCDECDSRWETECYTPDSWARVKPYRTDNLQEPNLSVTI